MRVVTYRRVSTREQQQSGLGLEGQAAAIADFVKRTDSRIVGAYVETESGRDNERPQLAAALAHCRRHKATLLIAKLDRLSRSVSFLANLMDSNVEFIAIDNASANRLTLHVLAAVAEDEARRISERTKTALAAAKARGTRLGNPNGAAALQRAGKGNAAAVAAVRAGAAQRASDLKSAIEELRASGIATLAGLAEALNMQGMAGARGGAWHASSVSNLLRRLAIA